LAVEKLHSVFDIRRQNVVAHKMGRHRAANLGFDVINLLRPQRVQSFSNPELIGSVSFYSLDDFPFFYFFLIDSRRTPDDAVLFDYDEGWRTVLGQGSGKRKAGKGGRGRRRWKRGLGSKNGTTLVD
jgi:hypothetical protein